MPQRWKGLLAAVLWLLMMTPAQAAEPKAPRSMRVTAAGRPVRAQDGSRGAELVTIKPNVAARLLGLAVDGALIVKGWPTGPGERSTVELTRFEVYAPEARIVKAEGGGLVDLPRSRLVFFRGVVTEDPDARVMLSVDPDTRRFAAMTSRRRGVQELRSWGTRGDTYLLASSESFEPQEEGERPTWSCAQESMPFDRVTPSLPGLKTNKAITTMHTATVAVDTDNELLLLKFSNNTTAATNYIASLIASMTVMYERDLLVRLVQGFTILRPSTSVDPYNQPCTVSVQNGINFCIANSAQLSEFSNYWAGGCGGSCAGVSRALAMMLSGKGLPNTSSSGIAWLDGLCSTTMGYSFSQVFKYAGSTAANDSRLVGHEQGHVFGSPHTHCYSPPIDTCYNQEPCYTGPTGCPAPATYNGVPNVRGTVMSYCHLLGGCTASEVFHPRTVSLLAPLIEEKVGQCIFPSQTTIFRDGFESGPPLPGAWSDVVP